MKSKYMHVMYIDYVASYIGAWIEIKYVILSMIVNSCRLLNDVETRYAMNNLTHVDFLIFNKMDKKPCLVIEVDGFIYHEEKTEQHNRDNIKNVILDKYNINYKRFRTNESDEESKILEELKKI